MHTSPRKVALLVVTVYSFFTCFLMNVFGQLTYEWNIPNIYEGRKAVFNSALLHFALFALCVGLHFRGRIAKQKQFKPIRTSESGLHDEQENVI